jgi:hypothetical protein
MHIKQSNRTLNVHRAEKISETGSQPIVNKNKETWQELLLEHLNAHRAEYNVHMTARCTFKIKGNFEWFYSLGRGTLKAH